MNHTFAQRIETIKVGMQKLAEFATKSQKTAAAPAAVSAVDAAKVKELSLEIGSKLAALQLISTDAIEKNAAAFDQSHVKTLNNTVKILDHFLSERAASKSASVPSLGTVVDADQPTVKKQEGYRRPRC